MTALPSIADFDQLLADARMRLGAWRQTTATLVERRGEMQGVADVLAMLAIWDRTDVESVLMAALIDGGAR